MTRPAPRYTTSETASNEAQDRAFVQTLGVYDPPLIAGNEKPVVDPDELEFLTRRAGLLGGWSALYAAAVAANRKLPGHSIVSTAAWRIHKFSDEDRLPLLWRAWALEFATSLVDSAAEQPASLAVSQRPWW
jgi:hypothetical protein